MKKTLRVLAAAAVLAQSSPAAVFTVTNANDAGAGSLRQAIIDANAAGGTNTINWAAGSGGTLTLASGLPTLAAGNTLDVTNAPAAVTIAGGANSVALGGGTVFANGAAAQNWTISTVIDGVGALTKTGAGTLTLTGANAYAGGTSLNAGTLNVNADAALGTGGVTFAGGTLQTAAGVTSAKNVAMNGAGTIDTQGFNSTLSGVISGGGTLTVLGTGKLSLSGANTFTGGVSFNAGILNVNAAAALGSGAVTFNGGTLQTGSAMTIVNGMTLGGGGGTIDLQGSSVTLSGSIGGAGALTVVGITTLTVVGGNSYGGGTTLNGGTLNINNASGLGTGALTFNGGTLQTGSTMTFSNGITLGAGGGTIDALGNVPVFSGVIGGAGALTSASTSSIVLSGVNTYSGGTNLNAGSVKITNSSALGTGTVVFNGGALKTSKGVALTNAMTVNAGGGTIDTDGFDASVSGVIGGAGNLTKAGLGTLTLSGANAYGNTTVSAGALALGASNSLPAGKNLTVNSGATFDMAAYTQTVAAFVGAGNTKMTLRTAVTNLGVTGNANLTGGTLTVAPAPGQVLTAGQTFTPITAGSFTGTFSSIVSPAALSFTPTYNAGDVTLTTVLVPFANVGSGANQAGLGSSLEFLRSSPTGDNATVLAALYQMDAPALRGALDQFSPVSLASMQGVGLAASGAQSASVGQRMAALADGSDQSGFHNYSVTGPSPYPGTLFAMAGEGDDHGVLADGRSPWGYFASAAATVGKLAEAHSDAGTQPGYAFNSGGLTMGADYRFEPGLAAGGSIGYLRGHASILAPGAGTVDNDSIRFGAYGTAGEGNLKANAYLGSAVDFYKTNRVITAVGAPRSAKASPLGTEIDAQAKVSYDLRTAEHGIFTPFAGLTYNRLMIGGFTETGAGALNLSVGAQTAESLQSTLGLRYGQEWKTEERMFKPFLSLGWRREFVDQSRPMTARFATGVASPFTVSTGRYARDGVATGAGVSVNLGRATTAKLEYEGDFRSHFQSTVVNAGVRFAF